MGSPVRHNSRYINSYLLVLLSLVGSLLLTRLSRPTPAPVSSTLATAESGAKANDVSITENTAEPDDVYADSWEQHDLKPQPNSTLVPALVFLVPLLISVALSIRSFVPTVVDEKTLGHALSGLPVLITAIGAAAVAAALIVRSTRPALMPQQVRAERHYKFLTNHRPTMSKQRARANPEGALRHGLRHQERETDAAAKVVKAKTRLARRGTIASSLEISGALVLVIGAVFAYWAWSVGL